MRVVVVGGGIAGLAAAHALAGRADVTVVEAGDRVGGKLRTSPVVGPFGSLDVEEGAESFLARVPDALRLARAVGLGHDVIHPATTAASLLVRGKLRPIPPNTLLGVPTDALGLIKSRVLSPLGLVRAAADLVLPRSKLPEDPTVGAFVGARVGRQVVDRLVDPLLGGVYAGRADALSLGATVPQLTPIASEDRSLLLGAHRVRARTGPASTATPVFASVRGGLGRFAVEVARASGATVELGVIVRELRRSGSTWQVRCARSGPTSPPGREEWVLDADAVVLAVPASAARVLLAPVAGHTAALLAGVPYASVALVTMVYEGRLELPGSGFLVPRGEAETIKAATFLTSKWPNTAQGAAVTIVRASVGRAGDQRDLQRGDTELAGVVAAEVAGVTGLHDLPVATRVSRWGGALPQYLPGHVGRVAAARRALPDGVYLAGAGYDGIGIPACIRSGQAAAEAVGERLGSRDTEPDRGPDPGAEPAREPAPEPAPEPVPEPGPAASADFDGGDALDHGGEAPGPGTEARAAPVPTSPRHIL